MANPVTTTATSSPSSPTVTITPTTASGGGRVPARAHRELCPSGNGPRLPAATYSGWDDEEHAVGVSGTERRWTPNTHTADRWVVSGGKGVSI